MLATAGEDGTLRLWSRKTREQLAMFHPSGDAGAACSAVAISPCSRRAAGGYADGTVRIYDLVRLAAEAEFRPHDGAVTAAAFSTDGAVLISGSSSGLLVVSSATAGSTLRVISEHRGAAITSLDFDSHGGSGRWAAASQDRRISVWAADWDADTLDVIDFLTFPARPFVPSDQARDEPPTLARFSPGTPETLVLAMWGQVPELLYYSLPARSVVKRVRLTTWAASLAASPRGNLVAVGTADRLVKLVDWETGHFQDFVAHASVVRSLSWSHDGAALVSTGREDAHEWEIVP